LKPLDIPPHGQDQKAFGFEMPPAFIGRIGQERTDDHPPVVGGHPAKKRRH
jgi:hypothetical protein